MLDGVLNAFHQVQGVAQVVVDVGETLVEREGALVELDGFLGLGGVVVGVAQAD